MTYLGHGQIMVIETEDDRFLGTAQVVDGRLVIRSGSVGRPTVVELDDVLAVNLASGHEDVLHVEPGVVVEPTDD